MTPMRVLLLFISLTQCCNAFHLNAQRRWEYPRSSTLVARDHRKPSATQSATAVWYRTQHHSDTHDFSRQDNDRSNDERKDELVSSLMRSLHFTNNTVPTSHGATIVVPKDISSTDVVGTTKSDTTNTEPHIFDHMKDLIAMARPENLPGVVLFHMIGSCLAYRHYEAVALGSSVSGMSYLQLLSSPSMLITLGSLLLVSSTSMLVNDYYDFKLGNDSLKPDKPVQKVPLAIVKKALMHLYTLSLFCTTMVPGIPARVAVIGGLVLTFLYTKHVKPKTWAKNALCASLIALSPLTSGVAAMSVLSQASSTNLLFEYINWPLVRLVSLLFVGIMGREISMDINDTEDDSAHSVRTVPVVYGRSYASHVAWISSLVVAGLAVSGPILATVDPSVTVRRAALAGIGSLLQMRRYRTVAQTKGRDSHAIDIAVDEGLLSMVLLVASFI